MGQYELAIPGALQSLRFSMEVYGSGRIELVPAYLLLAESNLGLKRYKVAEEFLLYANWSVLKNNDCSNELKSQLYRNFGKLYASQGRFQDALRQLALDVYYSSLESGPEHIDTAGGYFYLADVFMTQGVVEHALALYDKVVDVFYKFLVNLRHRPEESIADYLSEAAIGEAVEMLRSILETRRQQLGSNHIATGEAAYALGILKHVTGFDLDARQHYAQALAIYTAQLGAQNESTVAIQRAIEDLPPIPQQLLLKQQAALEAQKAIEESRKEQARQQQILEQNSIITQQQQHEHLQQAHPSETLDSASASAGASSPHSSAAEAAAAAAVSPSAPADLQEHLAALQLESARDRSNGDHVDDDDGDAEADAAEAGQEEEDEAAGAEDGGVTDRSVAAAGAEEEQQEEDAAAEEEEPEPAAAEEEDEDADGGAAAASAHSEQADAAEDEEA
jgi:hypothetical protein